MGIGVYLAVVCIFSLQ